MTTFRTILALIFLASRGLADEPRPAITIRLDRPEEQGRAILELFRGSKAAHPAAALAAWKRASREPNRLGKPLEGLIASLNPAMVGELRSLDGAELALSFETESGRLEWGAQLPKDDGTFAAIATSMVLSGGAAENPMDGQAVDRLGPAGAPLMSKAPSALLLAGSRDALRDESARASKPRLPGPDNLVRFQIEPRALDGSTSLAVRRLRAGLIDAGRSISGSAGLDRSTLMASIVLAAGQPAAGPTVEREWLDWIPADRAMVAFAMAIDRQADNWNAVFRIVDRIERVDPLRGDLAPSRLRLDLLARAVGIRADADVLSKLKGATCWLGSGGAVVDRAFLMLHLIDEAAARRIFDRVKPFAEVKAGEGPAPAEGRPVGRLQGRDIRLYQFGPSIAVAWGDGVIEDALRARALPDRPSRKDLEAKPICSRPVIIGGLWPARVPGLVPLGTPLAEAISAGPPIRIVGGWGESKTFQINAAWDELDSTVRRFLKLIPMDAPPDH